MKLALAGDVVVEEAGMMADEVEVEVEDQEEQEVVVGIIEIVPNREEGQMLEWFTALMGHS